VGLRFAAPWGLLAPAEMDPEPSELGKLDERASRARTILFIVMAVLTASPFIVYAILGRSTAPTQ
jgi:hypothetical protein